MATMNSIHLVVDESASIGRAVAGDAALRPAPTSKESVAKPFAFVGEDKKIVF